MSGLPYNNQGQILVLFGGTGDLTFRKLLPALYNLLKTDRLPEQFKVLIVGRQPFTNETYHQKMKQWIEGNARFKLNELDYQRFTEIVEYVEMNFGIAEDYNILKQRLDLLDGQRELKRIYYFAVAPSSFALIANSLKASGLAGQYPQDMVIIEKPFGDNLESAQQINAVLEATFVSENIYRIDHYLAKEMVQNVLAIRFANVIFEGIWSHSFIDNIQISASETVGVETRGNYYDHSGAIKDMVQNHLLQILSLITMEKPLDDSAKAIHDAQYEVLKQVRFSKETPLAANLVLGQYQVADETEENKSYRHEDKVNPESSTETFVALKLQVDNPRFKGVPIYLRTGKRMHKRSTEIAITFKAAQYQGQAVKNDVLLIKVQPDEGVYFKFNIKKPGQENSIQSVFMDFCQSCIYENRLNTPEAYERLLFAALNSDSSLFTSWDIAQNNWQFIETLNQAIKYQKVPLYFYESFTQGPLQAQQLLQKEGHDWVEEKVLGDEFVPE